MKTTLNISTQNDSVLLGIDTGTSKNTLGYAIVKNNQLLAYDCLDGSNPFASSEILKYLIHDHNVEQILIEDYIYMQHFTYHTMFAHAKKAHMLIGYLSGCFDRLGIPYEIVSPVKWKNSIKKYYQYNGHTCETASEFVKEHILNDELKKDIQTKADFAKNSHWIEAIGICYSKYLTDELAELESSEKSAKNIEKNFKKIESLSKIYLKKLETFQKSLKKLQKNHIVIS